MAADPQSRRRKASLARFAVATIADLDEALAAAARRLSRPGATPGRSPGPSPAPGSGRWSWNAPTSWPPDLTREQGKPLAQARMEIEGCARAFDWAAEEGAAHHGRVIRPTRRPMWIATRHPDRSSRRLHALELPASQAAAKIGSAIAAGCSMILKGPEDAPSGCVGLAQALVDAGLPPAC